MKVIIDNNITAVSASSENTNYLASNVLNKHPKRVWKCVDLVSDARITLTVSGSVTNVGIANTNAVQAYMSKNTTSELTWFTSSGSPVDWDGSDGSTLTWESGDFVDSQLTLIDTDTGDIWIELTNYNIETLILRLVAESGETLHAGVVVAGEAVEYPNQKYPIQENLIDYSFEDTLSNGSHYYRQGNIVREYSFDAGMMRDTDALSIMRDIGMKKGKSPLMWRLTAFNNSQWIVYGRLEVSQSHEFAMNNVSMKITEAV